MDEIEIDGIKINIIKKDIKSLILRISRYGEITLSVPYSITYDDAKKFVFKKIDWIKKHIKPKINKNKFTDGEIIYLWGIEYKLKLIISKKQYAEIVGNEIIIYCKAKDKFLVENILYKFMKKMLLERVLFYIYKWSNITELKPKEISIRRTISKWGSCNTKTHNISISLYIICFEEFCLDYVCLHEILHIKYPNHGKMFKLALDKYMSNWKDIKKYMNINASIKSIRP